MPKMGGNGVCLKQVILRVVGYSYVLDYGDVSTLRDVNFVELDLSVDC